jgi:hypothetical protein
MIGRPETHPVKKIIGFSEEMVRSVEIWRAKQKPVPNLSEAIRRLVEIGLLSSTNSPDLRYQEKASESATKAKRLAGELGLKAKR